MSNSFDLNDRPSPDKLLLDIADYVMSDAPFSDLAYSTARHCLMDTLGCGLLALRFPECTKHLGPLVAGADLPTGARVPGTSYQLDPVKAAWDIGCIIRWLDYNDTWLAAEWGHPSDNLGGILAVADYLSRQAVMQGKQPLTMHHVLQAMIKAHEIQGVIALENSFNRVGLDHVLLVRVASTAVVTKMLGGNKDQVINALSHAWVDGCALRTYRHAPNAGSRKSWAAGDATSRGVRLALIAMKDEMGMPAVLTTPTWGFQDVNFNGKSLSFSQGYDSYVMENILFKISFPAEFHAQTAVECAVQLHQQVKGKINEIDKILLTTHESAIRIISKVGPLANPADRDHCLQYMVAVGLLEGDLMAEHYEDSYHNNKKQIDQLREKMQVVEDTSFSADYLDQDKRSIANAIEIIFKDGTKSDRVQIEYPIGHRRRRAEGIPALEKKFMHNLQTCFTTSRSNDIMQACANQKRLEMMPVHQFMDMLVF